MIEILIVIALVALITTVAIPSLSNVFRASGETFARNTALLLREARDRALLTDKLIRLRVDLDKQEIWLEEAASTYLMPRPADKSLSQREREDRDKREGETFRLVKQLTPEKRKVPTGIKLVEVQTPRLRDPAKEGMVDVYFFNNGNADAAVLRFESEEGVTQTVHLHPVTGQSRIDAEKAKP